MPVRKLRGKSILCIGNDFVNLNLRCALLAEHGYEVFSSGNGHDGVIRFGQEKVDAVVLDLDTDGSESALILSELKRQSPGIPVVMLVKERETLAPGATAQADAVLLKSEETEKLYQTLQGLLGPG
jgi:two-component system response regulator GlrR